MTQLKAHLAAISQCIELGLWTDADAQIASLPVEELRPSIDALKAYEAESEPHQMRAARSVRWELQDEL